MKDTFNRVALLAAAIVVFAMSPFFTYAQTEGLQIKPAIIEDRAKPGESFTFNLTITNLAETQKVFFLSAQDIRSVDDQGRPVFAEEGERTGYELGSWVRLPGGSISLKAGETRAIPFTVEVPTAASPGSHFAGIFLTDKPAVLETSGSAISIRVGSIVSLRIAGEARDEARIREFSTGKIVYSEPNVDFNARVENLGNVLVRPRGIIEISNMFGRTVGSVEINADAAAVFPAAFRIFSSVWESDSFAFGRYQAIVSFSYGEDAKKTISETTSFWVLPLKAIAITLFSIIVGVFLVYRGIKAYIRRKLNEMGAAGTAQGRQAGLDYYAQKYQRSSSRLIMIVTVLFIVCVLMLALLFAMFA